FEPPPRVDVVMLRLRKRGPPLIGRDDHGLYRDLVTHCFAAWRPSLHTTLTALVGRARASQLLQAADLPPEATPSALRPEQWLALFGALPPFDRRAVLAGVLTAEAPLRRQQRSLSK